MDIKQKDVERAIEHEIVRHAELIEKGEEIAVETRNFDAVSGTTIGLRKKEAAHDYRYFPEPDLTALHVTLEYINEVERNLPPLPNDLYKKYIKELQLSDYDAMNLTDSKSLAMYFEELIQHTKNYKAAANWMMGSVKSFLNQNALEIEDFPISSKAIADLIAIIDEGKISNSVASQKVFPELLKTPEKSPLQIAEENQWIVKSDSNELEEIIKSIFENNPGEFDRYKNGEKKLTGFFMGLVMRETKGAADPKTTSQLLNKIANQN